MKTSATYSSMLMVGTLALLLCAVVAAPMDAEDEQTQNGMEAHSNDINDVDYSGSMDAINTAALRKLLLQLDADDRLARVSRSWPQAEPRSWGVRAVLDGRLARQWRADKRQVRFRQCYFNPISCFRK
ncbi:allatostatin [Hyposmocoma kahamanoa]|uniref:allatostatin n=1 Tax=Hyposmocoma kahamanoa TaxID=1477025 RepID=UPI000E6D805C|nr:allatostatin [Hyposmocoma kahamanoa]